MTRKAFWLTLTACLCVGSPARAQLGLNLFRKPNIADVFKPVVGKGGVYETVRAKDGTKHSLEMTIIGKESVDGKEAYWMEVAHDQDRSGQVSYAKMLLTKEDFQARRMIFQQPGKPAMEFPMNFNAAGKNSLKHQEELEKWHQIGSESITVPAGTFSCQHWQKEDGKGDAWISDKVSPFGVIKMVSPTETMTLVKVINDAKDHISGPVQQVDPQLLRQQMMEQNQ